MKLDRSEGALLVAETALEEIKRLSAVVAELSAKVRPSVLLIDDAGYLQSIGADGDVRSIGRVRGQDGRDAVSVVNARVDDRGDLYLTLSDGASLNAGRVVGPSGKDGKDGLGFDDLDVVQFDDPRQIALRFRRGEQVKHYPIDLRTVSYRGIWSEGEYRMHDAVTYSGSLWIAVRDTSSRPKDKASDWQLAVKCGRDGKDGKDGPSGPQGAPGAPGRDLTQIAPDGSKW